MATVEEIRALSSAEARAVAAHGFITRGAVAVDAARTVRNAAVVVLRAEGWTQVRIAKLLGITQVTVSKILNSKGTS